MFKQKAITLAKIWLEIVKKCYQKLCDNISRSSLLKTTDAMEIIFQHMLKHVAPTFSVKNLNSDDFACFL